MECLVGQHDTVLAIKEEFPAFISTKVENEEDEKQHSVETIECSSCIKSEEIDIKLEKINYESIKSIKEEYLASKVEEDFNTIYNLKQESICIDQNHFDLKKEVGNIKTEQIALTSIPGALLSSNPEGKHTLAHQNTFEKITSAFKTCPPDSKYTPSQRKQKSATKKKSCRALLKCEQCSYECDRPSHFHLHMRVHKDPSELHMYECTHCDFKTKYRYSLKGHSILHKDAADVPIYKCNSCNFESKRKGSLARHIWRYHKSSTVIGNSKKDVLTCEQCSYECRYPSELHLHMRRHKNPSELNMYKCAQCDFVTKHRRNLRSHFIIHKDTTEVPQYKCNTCNFKTTRKAGLKRHITAIHQRGHCTDEPAVSMKSNSNTACKSTC